MKIIKGNGDCPKTPNWYHFKHCKSQPEFYYVPNEERIPHKVSTNVYYEFDVGDLVWFEPDIFTRLPGEVIERKPRLVYGEPSFSYLVKYTGWCRNERREATREKWVSPFNGDSYQPCRLLNPREMK